MDRLIEDRPITTRLTERLSQIPGIEPNKEDSAGAILINVNCFKLSELESLTTYELVKQFDREIHIKLDTGSYRKFQLVKQYRVIAKDVENALEVLL